MEPRLPQPVFVGEVLQPSDHLCGPSWTLCSSSLSFLYWAPQTWMRCSRWVFRRAEQRGTVSSPCLLVVVLRFFLVGFPHRNIVQNSGSCRVDVLVPCFRLFGLLGLPEGRGRGGIPGGLEAEWKCGGAPARSAAGARSASGRLSSPRRKSAGFPGTVVVCLVLWVVLSLSFCWLWLTVVKHRSSSDRCRCVFCWFELPACSVPFPLSRIARPGAGAGAGLLRRQAVRSPSFLPSPSLLCLSSPSSPPLSRGSCAPLART